MPQAWRSRSRHELRLISFIKATGPLPLCYSIQSSSVVLSLLALWVSWVAQGQCVGRIQCGAGGQGQSVDTIQHTGPALCAGSGRKEGLYATAIWHVTQPIELLTGPEIHLLGRHRNSFGHSSPPPNFHTDGELHGPDLAWMPETKHCWSHLIHSWLHCAWFDNTAPPHTHSWAAATTGKAGFPDGACILFLVSFRGFFVFFSGNLPKAWSLCFFVEHAQKCSFHENSKITISVGP